MKEKEEIKKKQEKREKANECHKKWVSKKNSLIKNREEELRRKKEIEKEEKEKVFL